MCGMNYCGVLITLRQKLDCCGEDCWETWAESSLCRMTVFVICLLTPWQTAIRKKENSLRAGTRKKWESDSPPQAWDPQIMKGIKFLSLSQYKHKLFWHLINRQRSIVFRARQVCLVHFWWLLLFCWGSVFAFLSYIVTHLSRERRAT